MVAKPNLPSKLKPYQTKQEWVFSTLKDAIQSCTLQPGTRLTLDEVAAQLNVSRVPVREALLQLQIEGLVDMTPHAGAVVSLISPESIHELFMILEDLEVLAGRVAAKKLSPEGLKDLEDTMLRMEEAIAAGDPEEWSELNTDFHRKMSILTGMPFLRQLTERALERWDRLRRCLLMQVLDKRSRAAQEEHRRIYEALKRGDVTAVEQTVRAHNRNALKAYLAYLSENPALGSDNCTQTDQRRP